MADNLSPTQRRYAMSRVHNKDTEIERMVRSALHTRGLRFTKHDRSLPGTPDVVFSRRKVVVFIDGDFWHGYRYPAWKDRVSEFWRSKIEKNRLRDRKNFRKLRRMRWRVIRIWQHQIQKDIAGCLDRIGKAVQDDRRPLGKEQ